MPGPILDILPRLCVFAMLTAWVVGSARAADPERAELSVARQRIEADHAQRVAQCRKQFIVTSCVDAAAAARREGLAALHEREVEIDDRERRARAYARQSRIEAKQQRAKDRPEPLPLVPADQAARRRAVPEAAASAPARTPHSPTPRPEAGPARPPAKPKAVDTQEQAARYDARQEEARNRRAAAAERRKERERSGKPTPSPLPPVDAAAPPRAASAP